jgi:hypothetical protein
VYIVDDSLAAMVIGFSPMTATDLIDWLIAGRLICITIMVVNIAFNGGIFTRR